MPAILLTHAFRHFIALSRNQGGNAVSKLGTNLLDGNVRILHGVVQGGGSQKFLVRGNGGHNFHGLHGMYNIREALSAALGARVGLDGENDGAVQQFSVQWFICHNEQIYAFFR